MNTEQSYRASIWAIIVDDDFNFLFVKLAIEKGERYDFVKWWMKKWETELETLKREGFELNDIAETIRKYLKENPEYSKAILESEERYLKKCKETDKDYEIINKRIKRRGITNDLDAKIVETQYFMQKEQRKQKKK